MPSGRGRRRRRRRRPAHNDGGAPAVRHTDCQQARSHARDRPRIPGEDVRGGRGRRVAFNQSARHSPASRGDQDGETKTPGRGLCSMLDAQRADQERLLRSLLQIFEEQLMPTYRSRYTQYVVFYFVCLRPDFPDALLALLVRAHPGPWQHAQTRTNAHQHTRTTRTRVRPARRCPFCTIQARTPSCSSPRPRTWPASSHVRGREPPRSLGARLTSRPWPCQAVARADPGRMPKCKYEHHATLY